jgi:hypothetical protein
MLSSARKNMTLLLPLVSSQIALTRRRLQQSLFLMLFLLLLLLMLMLLMLLVVAAAMQKGGQLSSTWQAFQLQQKMNSSLALAASILHHSQPRSSSSSISTSRLQAAVVVMQLQQQAQVGAFGGMRDLQLHATGAAAKQQATATIEGEVGTAGTAMHAGSSNGNYQRSSSVESLRLAIGAVRLVLLQLAAVGAAAAEVPAGVCGQPVGSELVLTDELHLLTQTSSSSSSVAAVCMAASQPHQIMRQEAHPDHHHSMVHLLMCSGSDANSKDTANSSSRLAGSGSKCLLQILVGITSRRSHQLMHQLMHQQRKAGTLGHQASPGCAASHRL